MMIVMDQLDVNNQDENWKPPFLVGCPEVLDPIENVLISSYGITDMESASRIHGVYNLWGRRSGVSGGRAAIEAPGG